MLKILSSLITAILIISCGSTKKSQDELSSAIDSIQTLTEQETSIPDPADWILRISGRKEEAVFDGTSVSDGGAIFTGRTNSAGKGSYDLLLLKTDHKGEVEWINTYGSALYEDGMAVTETKDGGFIIAGESTNDILVIRTTGKGEVLWSRTFGAAGRDFATAVDQTPDGGFITAGATRSFSAEGFDYFLIKTDSAGNLQWTKNYGGKTDEIPFSIKSGKDHFVMTGLISGKEKKVFNILHLSDVGKIIIGKEYALTDKEGARISHLPEDTAANNIELDKTNTFILFNSSGSKVKERHYGFSDQDFLPSTALISPEKNYWVSGVTENHKGKVVQLNRWKEEIDSVKMIFNNIRITDPVIKNTTSGFLFTGEILYIDRTTDLLLGYSSDLSYCNIPGDEDQNSIEDSFMFREYCSDAKGTLPHEEHLIFSNAMPGAEYEVTEKNALINLMQKYKAKTLVSDIY